MYENLLLNLRKEAREAKNFHLSDKIRDELKVIGVEIKDNKDGTTTTSYQKKRRKMFKLLDFFRVYKSLAIAVPAAPAPDITTLIVAKSFCANFKALISHAKTTIAVPC